ncbi:hypothetical protein [Peribacillus simplex]|uniref:hypothetical protein n=1 Tax=Peribacillus simplex TaxID=1478 RepID=UPI0028534A02|nr:hypothetical protein [Peribacillus simplex]MDR4928922.1 hypothetical protein [Peribacillus simplex]
MTLLDNAVKWDNQVLEELKSGNREVLKGLPPVLALQYGVAMQNELLGSDYVDTASPIDNKAVEQALIERLKPSEVKEELVKRIEAENAEFENKVEAAKLITDLINN